MRHSTLRLYRSFSIRPYILLLFLQVAALPSVHAMGRKQILYVSQPRASGINCEDVRSTRQELLQALDEYHSSLQALLDEIEQSEDSFTQAELYTRVHQLLKLKEIVLALLPDHASHQTVVVEHRWQLPRIQLDKALKREGIRLAESEWQNAAMSFELDTSVQEHFPFLKDLLLDSSFESQSLIVTLQRRASPNEACLVRQDILLEGNLMIQTPGHPRRSIKMLLLGK
jgi:hypothetical protein